MGMFFFFFIQWFVKNDAYVHDFADKDVFSSFFLLLYFDLNDVAKKFVHKTLMPKSFWRVKMWVKFTLCYQMRIFFMLPIQG